jgi:hypothetical protein
MIFYFIKKIRAMKYIYILFLLLAGHFTYAQGDDDYEDGSLEDWTNTDLTETMLTNEAHVDPPYPGDLLFLQKECDGTNTAVGEMAIINNSEEWTGTYPTGFFDAFVWIEMLIKNDNDFDLHLRLGYRGGSDNTKIVSNEATIIPAFSDWTHYDLYATDFTVIEGTNTWEEVFEDSHEAKIIHNEATSYDGEIVSGTLKISSQFSVYLLSNDEQSNSKFTLYPNPAKDLIHLRTPNIEEGRVVLIDLLGKKVMDEHFSSITSQIDISELKSGIYMVRIETEDMSITRKIVKI